MKLVDYIKKKLAAGETEIACSMDLKFNVHPWEAGTPRIKIKVKEK